MAPSTIATAITLALVAASPAYAQTASTPDGAELYRRCAGCHSVDRNRTGPRHCGVFGRAAGTQPGYRYSPAMKNSGLQWNALSLDAFLADPRGVVPGTRMTIAGISDPAVRAALIEFLRQTPPCA